MAIWSRKHNETRTYFNLDTALIKERDSDLTFKLFGITILRRKENFGAEVIEAKKGVGFNTK